MNYYDFLATKDIRFIADGLDINTSNMSPHLYEWQAQIVRWALKKGKAALFEDCGLGKTIQQLEWAHQICKVRHGSVIIFAPLAVATQTMREGEKFGIDVNVARDQSQIRHGINIANYEIMEKFNPDTFDGICLDESSILKHQTSKTRQYFVNSYKQTPFKLCCTATPAPNDFVELGNHSEFFGIMSRTEMLSTFFVHDGSSTQDWRLKGHAQDSFWEWIASWACVVKKPSDLGFTQSGYNLPKLNIKQETVKTDSHIDPTGQMLLFAHEAQTLSERRAARRSSLDERVAKAADVASKMDGQVLIWCDLNSESEALKNAIDGAVEVKGSDSPEHKTNAMLGFSSGYVKCLISKPSIAGWGMNWQNCHNMIFVGLSDSFESYYQAIRRCWRFGQDHEVNVYIVTSDKEGAVKKNIERKQRDAERMSMEMVKHTRDILTKDIKETVKMTENYHAHESVSVPAFMRR